MAFRDYLMSIHKEIDESAALIDSVLKAGPPIVGESIAGEGSSMADLRKENTALRLRLIEVLQNLDEVMQRLETSRQHCMKLAQERDAT